MFYAKHFAIVYLLVLKIDDTSSSAKLIPLVYLSVIILDSFPYSITYLYVAVMPNLLISLNNKCCKSSSPNAIIAWFAFNFPYIILSLRVQSDIFQFLSIKFVVKLFNSFAHLT